MQVMVRNNIRMETKAQPECCAQMEIAVRKSYIFTGPDGYFLYPVFGDPMQISYCCFCSATLRRPDAVEVQFQVERD